MQSQLELERAAKNLSISIVSDRSNQATVFVVMLANTAKSGFESCQKPTTRHNRTPTLWEIHQRNNHFSREHWTSNTIPDHTRPTKPTLVTDCHSRNIKPIKPCRETPTKRIIGKNFLKPSCLAQDLLSQWLKLAIRQFWQGRRVDFPIQPPETINLNDILRRIRTDGHDCQKETSQEED